MIFLTIMNCIIIVIAVILLSVYFPQIVASFIIKMRLTLLQTTVKTIINNNNKEKQKLR